MKHCLSDSLRCAAAVWVFWLTALLSPPVATGAGIVYEYDDAGRLVETSAATGSQTSYTLDPAGNHKVSETTIGAPWNLSRPTVPQNVHAQALATGVVQLTWSASSATAPATIRRYKIYRGPTAEATIQIDTSSTAAFTDTSTTAGTTYWYQVESIDSVGLNSGRSAAVTTTSTAPDTSAPSAPGNLRVEGNVLPGDVTLRWDASSDTGGSGLAGYKLTRYPSNPPLEIDIPVLAGQNVTTYRDVGEFSGAISYQLRAYDGVGNVSGYSNSLQVTVPSRGQTPYNLRTTTVTATQVAIAWDGQAAEFTVRRNGQIIGTAASNTYVDNSVSPSTSYTYTVQVSFDPNTGEWASLLSDELPVATPALEWIPLTNSSLIVLPEHAGAYGCSQSSPQDYPNVWLECHLTGSNAYVYYYDVTVNEFASGYRRNSSGQLEVHHQYYGVVPVDTTAPLPATGLNVTRVSATQVNLSWYGGSDVGVVASSGLAGYHIYRNGTHIASTTQTSYADSGVATDYSYSVASYDNAQNVSAQTGAQQPADGAPPYPPTGLAVTEPSVNQVQLTWNATTDVGSAGLAGYKVYRWGVEVATVGGTSYSESVAAGTQYSYTVRAYDSLGNLSGDSNTATITTSSPPQWITLTDSSLNVLPAHAGTYACWSYYYSNGDADIGCRIVSSGVTVYYYYVYYPGWETDMAPGYRLNNGALEAQSHLYGVNP